MDIENQRFIDNFLPLFNNDLTLSDIPNLIKVRDSFDSKSMNKYFSAMSLEDKRSIFNNVLSVLLAEYIPSLNIAPQDLIGFIPTSGEHVAIAKLSSNEDKIRYLCIGDAFKLPDTKYEEPDFNITINGYEDNEFFGTQLIPCISYGQANYIDYYFFNCLNLTNGCEFKGEGGFTYTFDTLNFNIKQDQNFEPVGMKDFHGNDLFDKSLIWIQFKGGTKYKSVINFDKNSGRCMIHSLQQGVHSDIGALNIWNNLIELKKIK